MELKPRFLDVQGQGFSRPASNIKKVAHKLHTCYPKSILADLRARPRMCRLPWFQDTCIQDTWFQE